MKQYNTKIEFYNDNIRKINNINNIHNNQHNNNKD